MNLRKIVLAVTILPLFINPVQAKTKKKSVKKKPKIVKKVTDTSYSTLSLVNYKTKYLRDSQEISSSSLMGVHYEYVFSKEDYLIKPDENMKFYMSYGTGETEYKSDETDTTTTTTIAEYNKPETVGVQLGINSDYFHIYAETASIKTITKTLTRTTKASTSTSYPNRTTPASTTTTKSKIPGQTASDLHFIGKYPIKINPKFTIIPQAGLTSRTVAYNKTVASTTASVTNTLKLRYGLTARYQPNDKVMIEAYFTSRIGGLLEKITMGDIYSNTTLEPKVTYKINDTAIVSAQYKIQNIEIAGTTTSNKTTASELLLKAGVMF